MNITDVLFINDDAVCIEILTSYGLLDKLVKRPDANYAAIPFHSETHWCMASLDYGHSEGKENGYTIIGMPKHLMNREEATAFFEDLILVHSKMENPVVHCEEIDVPRLTNN